MSKLLDEKGASSGNITQDVLENAIANALSRAGVGVGGTAPKTSGGTNEAERRLYFSGEKMHTVPKEFDMPPVGLFLAWKLWWFGNKAKKYPPFRLISTHDLSTRKKRRVYSDWSRMMDIMCETAKRIGKPVMPQTITEEQAADIYKEVIQTFDIELKKDKEKLHVTTMLRLILQSQYAKKPNYEPKEK